jgi:MFS family permease
VPIFRALFAAQLGSNIGNWMETVGAQWILVHHPRAETLVALVQTADMLPFMFLALPAGVFADLFDRRRYLIFVHLFLAATSGALAAATFAGVMGPALLLALTFLEGAGSALAVPAWQAIIPDLVPRTQGVSDPAEPGQRAVDQGEAEANKEGAECQSQGRATQAVPHDRADPAPKNIATAMMIAARRSTLPSR